MSLIKGHVGGMVCLINGHVLFRKGNDFIAEFFINIRTSLPIIWKRSRT